MRELPTPGENLTKDALSKVPLVTFGFWVTKILATTLGETGGDAVSMTLQMGYATASIMFMAFFLAALFIQVARRSYHPFAYWAVVVATTTVGTTVSDFLDRTMGLGYIKSSILLFGGTLGILFLWRFTMGRIKYDHVAGVKDEIFYWMTILASNTLGTALGDFVADDLGLGFERGAMVFAGLILIVGIGYYAWRVFTVSVYFWSAYILTRPLGATLGDMLTKSPDQGGLALGRIGSSVVILLIMILAIIITNWRFLNRSKRDLRMV